MKWIAIMAVNCLGWPLLQLSIAWAFGKFEIRRFEAESFWSDVKPWERACYRDLFNIRLWKQRLPDGASWFASGFSKKMIAGRDRDYLARFAAETRRSELAHWLMMGCLPIFFLWNPLWARAVMTLYALAANIPCIMVQRYNRAVLVTMLAGHDRKARFKVKSL